MPTNYPGALDTDANMPDKTDDIDEVMASQVNNVQDAAKAIELELGTDPRGAHANVKTRLNVQQKKLADADGDTKVDVEEAADEDKIRMDVKGVEAFLLHDDGILDLAKQSSCRAYRTTSDQTIATNTFTKVQVNAENWDNQNELDSTTHYRFTAKKPGDYQINAGVQYSSPIDSKRYIIFIYKNGGNYKNTHEHASSAGALALNTSDIAYLATNDYIEIYTYHTSGGDKVLTQGTAYTNVSIHKLS